MKKIIALLLAFTLTFFFAGCSNSENSSSTINGIDAGIIDTWTGSAKDSDSNITNYAYIFDSDGYYYMFVNDKQVSYGEYSTDDGIINIKNPQDESQSDSADYKIDGNLLILKTNGQELRLKRSDKEYIGLKINTLTQSSSTDSSDKKTNTESTTAEK